MTPLRLAYAQDRPSTFSANWPYARVSLLPQYLLGMVDIRVRDYGTLCLLDPLTENGRRWLIDNTTREWKWIDGCLAVQRRYAGPVLDTILADGLEVEV